MSAVTTGSPCHFLDELARWPGHDGRPWDLTLRQTIYKDLPDFGTPVMQRNVALALLALHELSLSRREKLLPDDPAAALRNLFLPGRYQMVLQQPDWIFDTAHNAQALSQALAAFLAEGERLKSGRNIVIYGAMEDKGTPPELAALFGKCDHVVGVPVTLPRSCTPDELRARFLSLGQSPSAPSSLWQSQCCVFDELGEALSAVAAGLQPEDRVLVTGSCFMVAETLYKMGVENLADVRLAKSAQPVLAKLQAATSEHVNRKDRP